MQKITIAVTGGNGQLGSQLKTLQPLFPDYDFIFLDRDDVDLGNVDAVYTYFAFRHFDFLINCAAYTTVDKAEEDVAAARQVNAGAVKTLAVICLERNIRLIHISTDYVFSGKGNQPINEDIPPDPISVYGQTKLEGENYIRELLPSAYIIRTAWLYSTFGKNFVKSIIDLTRDRSELGVVADQIGTPTYADDLARALLHIIDGVASRLCDEPGTYHYTNEGVASWYDVAYFVNNYYGFPCTIRPIRTDEYKTLAVRPKFSLLDKTKIKNIFGLEIPHWTESLKICLSRLPIVKGAVHDVK